MKHTHHIIPRHAGGTDDPTNLVELTIAEHADAHRILYEEHGRWQDYVAWQGLLGLMTEEERMTIMYNARKGEGNFFYGKTHTEETKKKISANRKGKGIGVKQSKEWINKRKLVGESNPMFGKEPWNKGGSQPATLNSKIKKGTPIRYNGIEYYGILEAARQNNTSAFIIKKTCEYL
jgi:hypothetical protein